MCVCIYISCVGTARADAHHLREEAHKDVKVATASLASATKLIAKARY
jgi:hypothetical protein